MTMRGATFPSDDVSTPAAKRRAYSLLIDKGLMRIALPKKVVDPYGCNTSSMTGLTTRRPHLLDLPAPAASTNLKFLTTLRQSR
jgi:hypothetical protein